VDASKDLTELVDLDPSRVDLVKNPANGFPILLMKAVSETAPETAPAAASETDATKETGVPETKNDTETPAPEAPEVSETKPEAVEKSAAELVQEEVAKAVQPLTEVIKGLREEMAALKSTPIPGGPVVTVPAAVRDVNEKARLKGEAAHYRQLAKSVADQELVEFYEVKASEAEKAASA
jgi:hypothetical protein